MIAFSLFLKHGFDPQCGLPFSGTRVTVSEATDLIDPHFTAVAWRLALEKNGLGPPQTQNDSGSGDDGDKIVALSETSAEELKSVLAKIVSASETDIDIGSVPGAWVVEESDLERDTGQVCRKFRSRPEDFTGMICGHPWDPSLYLIERAL